MAISLLCCLAAISCDGAYTLPGNTGGERTDIGVRLRFNSVKAQDIDSDGQQIGNLCIAVFDENDNLELFSRVKVGEMSEELSTQLSVTTGLKTVHAVANVSEALAGELSSAATKGEFLSAVTVLDRDNAVSPDGTYLLMHGSIDGKDAMVDVEPAGADGMTYCAVIMEHVASKICLHRITNRISEPLVWKECDIAVTGVFLHGANIESCIGEGSYRQTSNADWSRTSLLGDAVTDCSLAYGESYGDTPFAFYTYSGAGDAVTYLCLETVLTKGEARKKCYYNIPVEGITRNRLYNVKSITINSAGTDNPGERHSYDYVSVDLDDMNWEDGESTTMEY